MSTELPGRLATTAEAAELLDVPVPTIVSWKKRRRIMPVKTIAGRGRGGSHVYDLDDLRPLAEKYHQQLAKRSSRHTATG